MALDFKEIRKTVIDSVKEAIGDDLTQVDNPITSETYGAVFNARPNPEKPIPDYPYAVLDVLSVRDTDWYLTQKVYDQQTDQFQFETHMTIEMQISIYGGDAIMLAEKLKVSYRREDIIAILREGGLGIADVQSVEILPELLQTDFLEAAFIKLSVRVCDVHIDPVSDIIEDAIVDGELVCTKSGDPLPIHIDTTSN